MTTLRPVRRRSVPDEVTDQLVDGIVDGGLAAGESLPSERDLAERLGVSRPTVRAALTRLAAIGLVETRQGGGSTVRDYRRHAGLELLPRLLAPGGRLDATVLRDIVRSRTLLGPQVVRVAAAGNGARDEDLHAARRAIADAGDDVVARERAAVAFWDAVVDRGDSIVFRLLWNQLRIAHEPAIEALAPTLAAETARGDLYDDLLAALVAGDADRAEAVAAELLAVGAEALEALVDDLMGEDPR